MPRQDIVPDSHRTADSLHFCFCLIPCHSFFCFRFASLGHRQSHEAHTQCRHPCQRGRPDARLPGGRPLSTRTTRMESATSPNYGLKMRLSTHQRLRGPAGVRLGADSRLHQPRRLRQLHENRVRRRLQLPRLTTMSPISDQSKVWRSMAARWQGRMLRYSPKSLHQENGRAGCRASP